MRKQLFDGYVKRVPYSPKISYNIMLNRVPSGALGEWFRVEARPSWFILTNIAAVNFYDPGTLLTKVTTI